MAAPVELRVSPPRMMSVPARVAQEVVRHSLGQLGSIHLGLFGQPVVDALAAPEDYLGPKKGGKQPPKKPLP